MGRLHQTDDKGGIRGEAGVGVGEGQGRCQALLWVPERRARKAKAILAAQGGQRTSTALAIASHVDPRQADTGQKLSTRASSLSHWR
eukprot:scaffold23395_cov33-Tisochrysis_lutea.AAC.2